MDEPTRGIGLSVGSAICMVGGVLLIAVIFDVATSRSSGTKSLFSISRHTV